jgi:hypothetical protein
MNSTQFAHPPGIALYSPSSAFDLRPVAQHGQHEKGMAAHQGRDLRIPDPKLEEQRVMPRIHILPGYTEVRKPVYNYPNTNEGTGALMKPPALVNTQVARVSAKTYEIESVQVLNRLAGMPPVQYNRQWDQSYPRYEY